MLFPRNFSFSKYFNKISIVNYNIELKAQSPFKRLKKNLIRRNSKFLLVASISAAVIVILAVGAVLYKQYFSKTIADNEKIKWSLQEKERLLEQAHADLAQVQQQIAVLVEGRIPKLRPLVYDQTISISERYVRDVIFTRTGLKSSDRVFEFRVVLENDSNWMVTPQVQILLFNDIGIQVGVRTLTHHLATNQANASPLMAGEVRIYSSTIPLNKQREAPRYFLFEFHDT